MNSKYWKNLAIWMISKGLNLELNPIPNKFKNDAGLNYDRLKWRRKRGRLDGSLEILLKIKNKVNAGKIVTSRVAHTRKLGGIRY